MRGKIQKMFSRGSLLWAWLNVKGCGLLRVKVRLEERAYRHRSNLGVPKSYRVMASNAATSGSSATAQVADEIQFQVNYGPKPFTYYCFGVRFNYKVVQITFRICVDYWRRLVRSRGLIARNNFSVNSLASGGMPTNDCIQPMRTPR